MMYIATKIIVKGEVQGVSFRDFVRKEAVTLGLIGTVKNKEDGNVEIIAYGEQTDIDMLVKLCYSGPPFAKVNIVEVSEVEIDKIPKEFSIIYSSY